MLFVIQFAVLGIVASAVGVVGALIGQQLLATLLSSAFAETLPLPSWTPGLTAFATFESSERYEP